MILAVILAVVLPVILAVILPVILPVILAVVSLEFKTAQPQKPKFHLLLSYFLSFFLVK